MKKKLIALTLMLGTAMFMSSELKAQKMDSFFSYSEETREDPTGVGFNQMNNNNTPLSGGMLVLTATGLAYLINKRRKGDEK